MTNRRLGLVAAVSLLLAIGILALKYVAWAVTGSVALYSDALESIVNVLTAAAAMVAVRVGAQPADRRHPFGHHKAEHLSAVFSGALVIVAALLIAREAYFALREPRPVEHLTEGLLWSGAATLLNGLWAAFLVHRGRAWRSPALSADGHHLLSDVATSVGVLAGLVLAIATGIPILDPLIALAVGGYILWSGSRIVIESVAGLMDESAGAQIEQRIHEAIRAAGAGAIEAHDIRTRVASRVTFIEFHLVVPGDMTVEAAHAICDRLEEALEREIEGSEVTIHIEPEHKAKAPGQGAVEV